MVEESSNFELRGIRISRRVAIVSACVAVAGAAGGAKIVADQKSDGGSKKLDGKFVAGQRVYPILVFPLWSKIGADREKLGDVYFGDYIEILSGPYETYDGSLVYEVIINGEKMGYAHELHLIDHRI